MARRSIRSVIAVAPDQDCEPTPFELTRHVSAASFSPDGRRLLVQSAPTPHIDDAYMQTRMQVLNHEGGQVSSIDNLGKLGPVAWSPDSRRVAFIGVDDFNDPSAGRLKVANARNGRFSSVNVRELRPEISGDLHFAATVSDLRAKVRGEPDKEIVHDFGETDRKGEAPARDAMSPADFHATVVAALGGDVKRVLHTDDGRPIPVIERGGRPVREALA